MNRIRQALRNFFVPHEGNDHKPHALRAQTVAFVVVIALVAEAAFVFSAKYVIPNSKLFGIIETNALIDGTNQARQADGLPALTVNPLLMEAAREKANDMATKGYFAHTSPQGVTPWYWFENVGYSFSYAGENLAVNFSDSQDVTNAWLNSPEHRANIMSGDFTQIGMATAQGTFEGHSAIYVVEEFGTPAAAPIAFVNTASAASVPTTAPMPTVVTPAPAPVKTTAPAAKPAPKPVAVVPTVIAMQASKATSSQQSFVAIKGASVEQAERTSTATSSAAAPVPGSVTGSESVTVPQQDAAAAAAPQSNYIQRLFADPKELANNFYYLVMAIFFLALILNVFINIRVQYPRLIFGGLLVIVVAGLCVMLNQNVGFLHAVVL